MNKRPTVLWVSNMAPPYRLGVWKAMGDEVDLEVALLESPASMRRQASQRGRDWRIDTVPGARSVLLNAFRTNLGDPEARYYVIVDPRLVALVRRADAVVFGGWESPAYWETLLLAVLFRTARIGFYESTPRTMRHREGPISWARSLFFRTMTRCVVPGPAARESLVGLGVAKDRISVGFNAVDVRAFSAGSRGRSHDPAEGHVYVFVGRFVPLKRVHRIVESFAEIAGADDRLVLVGTGPLEDQLRALAQRRGVAERVEFTGYVETAGLPGVLARCHTLVLASDQEVWGLVVNEALASGCHVVVTENCGVVASVREMAGVFVVDESTNDLAEKMARSRAEWRGGVRNPEILRHTPEAFAATFVTTVRDAIAARTPGGRLPGRSTI